jgi:hypothetical protein
MTAVFRIPLGAFSAADNRGEDQRHSVGIV